MAAQPSIPAAPQTRRLRSAPPPPASREPEWVGRSWQAARREIGRYLRTAWAFGRAPRETARLWADGRFDALNPLAYLFNTAAIIGPWRALWQRILHTPDLPLWQDVIGAIGPFMGVLLVGSIFHCLFALLAGSTRKLSSTWAMSIYSTGGLPTLLQLAATPFALVASASQRPEYIRQHVLALAVSSLLPYPVLIWQGLALSGLHGTRRRTAMIILFVGTVVFGSALAALVFEGLAIFRLLRH